MFEVILFEVILTRLGVSDDLSSQSFSETISAFRIKLQINHLQVEVIYRLKMKPA